LSANPDNLKSKLDMKFVEDPRMKVCRRGFAVAWIYFSVYVLAIMLSSYLLGTRPSLWGLPRWIVIGNIIIPIVFVLLAIPVVEMLIPDIPLTDEQKGAKQE
jgi:uncharacterized membrane protein YhdT